MLLEVELCIVFEHPLAIILLLRLAAVLSERASRASLPVKTWSIDAMLGFRAVWGKDVQAGIYLMGTPKYLPKEMLSSSLLLYFFELVLIVKQRHSLSMLGELRFRHTLVNPSQCCPGLTQGFQEQGRAFMPLINFRDIKEC